MASAKAALINFCLDPFIQSIRTESVQADGYHVSNLVSTNLQAHTKGFRVEHFIRPPVSLDIHFTVPLHVGYILLELEMMGNRDVRIELSGRTMHPPFRQMAGATVREGGGGAIAMLRNKDFERKHGQVSPSGTNILGSYLKGKLSNCGVTGGTLKYSKALSALLCLQLSVTRVSGAKPVAIKFLEVWGHQSPASSAQDRLAFERAVGGLQIVQPFHSPPSQLGVYSSHHEHGNIPQSSLSGVYSANESISSGSSKVVGGKPVVPHTSSGSLSHRTNFQPSVSNIQSFGECNDGNPMMHCLRNEGIPPGAKPAKFLCESRKVIQEGLAADVTEVPGTSREHHHTRQHGCHLNHRRMEETGLMDGLQTAAAIETSEVQHLGLHFLSGNPEKMPASSSGRLGPPGEDNEEALVASSSGCPDTKEVCTDILRQPGFRIPGRAKSSSSSLRLLQQSGGVETTLVPRHSVSLKPTSSTLARQASLSTAAFSSSCYSPAIPEKFLDEITCELMVLPMLLPSGHYVDRSTLDRLGNMNATYGREDCDPFTGKVR